MVKNQLAKAGDARDVGLVPGSGRSPGGGQSNPLQHFRLENPMDRGAWWTTVHRVAGSAITQRLSTYSKNYTIRHYLITLYSLVPQRPRCHSQLMTDF